jgi:hypothetical protein
MDEQRKVHLMKCKVCSKIYVKDKMFALKIDSFWTHAKIRQATVVVPGVCGASEYYMSKDNIHVKNERLYAATRKD